MNKDVKDFTRIAYGCPLVEGLLFKLLNWYQKTRFCRYGQTECAACGTISLPFDTSYGNVGGPAPWAQVYDFIPHLVPFLLIILGQIGGCPRIGIFFCRR